MQMTQRNNFLIRTLRLLSKIWFTLATIAILGGYISIWYWEGFSKLQEVLSPTNFINVIAVVVVLLPGYGLKALAEKLENKQISENSQESQDND